MVYHSPLNEAEKRLYGQLVAQTRRFSLSPPTICKKNWSSLYPYVYIIKLHQSITCINLFIYFSRTLFYSEKNNYHGCGWNLKTKHFMTHTAIFILAIFSIILFTVRSCSSLSAPRFGFIYPHMCTSFPVSGTVCYFECRHGFLGNGGTTDMLCGNDGKWSKNESSILKCLGKCFVKHMS